MARKRIENELESFYDSTPSKVVYIDRSKQMCGLYLKRVISSKVASRLQFR